MPSARYRRSRRAASECRRASSPCRSGKVALGAARAAAPASPASRARGRHRADRSPSERGAARRALRSPSCNQVVRHRLHQVVGVERADLLRAIPAGIARADQTGIGSGMGTLAPRRSTRRATPAGSGRVPRPCVFVQLAVEMQALRARIRPPTRPPPGCRRRRACRPRRRRLRDG